MFNQEDKETDEEREEQGTEGEDGTGNNGAEESEGFSKKWQWIYLVDCVSEIARSSWDDVYAMNIYTFFNILSYRQDKKAEEKRQIELYKHR